MLPEHVRQMYQHLSKYLDPDTWRDEILEMRNQLEEPLTSDEIMWTLYHHPMNLERHATYEEYVESVAKRLTQWDGKPMEADAQKIVDAMKDLGFPLPTVRRCSTRPWETQ